MKKGLSFSIFCLFLWSTSLQGAESNLVDIPAGELLDAYLEDDSTKTRKSLVRSEPVPPPSIEGSTRNSEVEFRRVERSDGVEVYEVVPASRARATVADSNSVDEKPTENLEVIELETYNEDVVKVEAPDSGEAKVATTAKKGHIFCQENPLAKECLYAPYLSRCEKDPESLKCHSQLKQFEKFCETFPRAYKCKKAQLASTCKQQPELSECKSYTERYCQKYPKAIFCDWNKDKKASN